MDTSASYRIGIDLGGTKIQGVVLRPDGRTLAERRVPTPPHDYAAILQEITDLVAWLERQAGVRAHVGVGTPGSPSRVTGLMRNANTQCLNGKPLQRDLETRLQRPVPIANDANCFALSEAVDGAAAGADVVFGVILGTGTGGGICVGGRVVAGHQGIAGEWGHNPLPWPGPDEQPGPACYCGKRGCIETFLSGPGMATDHAAHTGTRLTAEEVAARATVGDPEAHRTLARYADRLARALASVINILDPDVIVLGGGLSNIASLYTHVPRIWAAHVFSDQVDTPLRPARHGDASGVRGAAWLT